VDQAGSRAGARRGGEAPLELAGRTVVLTGATAGIGRAAALALARRGARLVLVCRSAERGRAVLEEVRTAGRGAASELLGMDLASLPSVRIGAAELLRRHDRLDVLINNAGVWPSRRELSADGYELTFAVNHLAPFLLTRLLLPALHAARPARIVNVASEAHRRGRMHWDDPQLERRFSARAAYAQSKLANILFTRELARRLAGSGVTANSVHPGFIASELGRGLSLPARWAFRLLGGRPEDGARGPVLLASSPALAGVTGRYYDRTREATPSRAAQDDAAAARLWELSEQMTGPA
jgi:NAD(P)-dependent dehydrogenase (short-subunit alcohol dehydrogenase family)